jgi:hypothetical protein
VNKLIVEYRETVDGDLEDGNMINVHTNIKSTNVNITQFPYTAKDPSKIVNIWKLKAFLSMSQALNIRIDLPHTTFGQGVVEDLIHV